MSINFSQIMISLILTGTFALLFILGLAYYQNDNNQTETILKTNNLSIFAGNLDTNINNTYTTYNDNLNTFTTGNVQTTGGNLIVDSISGIWNTLKATPVLIYNLVSSLAITLFSNRAFVIIFSAVSSIFSLVLIMSVWKMLRQGEG